MVKISWNYLIYFINKLRYCNKIESIGDSWTTNFQSQEYILLKKCMPHSTGTRYEVNYKR